MFTHHQQRAWTRNNTGKKGATLSTFPTWLKIGLLPISLSIPHSPSRVACRFGCLLMRCSRSSRLGCWSCTTAPSFCSSACAVFSTSVSSQRWQLPLAGGHHPCSKGARSATSPLAGCSICVLRRWPLCQRSKMRLQGRSAWNELKWTFASLHRTCTERSEDGCARASTITSVAEARLNLLFQRSLTSFYGFVYPTQAVAPLESLAGRGREAPHPATPAWQKAAKRADEATSHRRAASQPVTQLASQSHPRPWVLASIDEVRLRRA